MVEMLKRECGLKEESKVADIGSGTGILSKLLLDAGCEVFGVEPNAEMREAAEKQLAGESRFHSVDGRAEATGLEDASVDFVTAAQSFHWFDIRAAKLEFRRILRPGGWVMLAWNERMTEGKFLGAYEALLKEYAPDYAKVDYRRMDESVMDSFFGAGKWRMETFFNQQWLDLAGVLGRLDSSSYAPPPGSEARKRMGEELKALFNEYNRDGRTPFRYETKAYVGKLD